LLLIAVLPSEKNENTFSEAMHYIQTGTGRKRRTAAMAFFLEKNRKIRLFSKILV